MGGTTVDPTSGGGLKLPCLLMLLLKLQLASCAVTARLHVMDSGGSEEVRAALATLAVLAWSGPTADAEPVVRLEEAPAHLAQAAPEGVTKASVVLPANWRAAAAVRNEAVAAPRRRRRRDDEAGTTIVLLLTLLSIYGAGGAELFRHQSITEFLRSRKRRWRKAEACASSAAAGPVFARDHTQSTCRPFLALYELVWEEQ